MYQSTTIFTYDDYLTLPNDGKHYEIIEGELYMTPAPIIRHQRVSRKLHFILEQFVRTNNLGEVFYAPVDVLLSVTDVVQPDLLFISKGREHIITKKNIIAAPDLIIEILSDATEKTDRTTKKALYERFGIREYWIVDPERRQVEVYSLQEAKYTTPQIYNLDEVVHSVLFPNLSFPVNEIF